MADAEESGPRPPSQRKALSFPSGYSLPGAIFFLITFIVVIVVLQIDTLKGRPWSSYVFHQWEQGLGGGDGSDCARKLQSATSRLREAVAFLPLKDSRLADRPMEGTTWFMSSLNDTYEGEQSQHLRFPSAASNGRLLCLAGNHTTDGTKNSYALAWPDALPHGAALLPGLTFVSDSYFDYRNLWHGLSATMPFFGWFTGRGCARPARWVLYHRGELRTTVGYWVRALAEVAMGQEVTIEDFAARGDRPTCFQEAVVFRHNMGAMSRRMKGEVYDMLRCRARAFCNVTSEVVGGKKGAPLIRMTLLLRTGGRSFKNESAVINAFSTACSKFEGCRFTVAWANTLQTFCDQVRALSATDVLVSPHGAQMMNLFFMDRNSSVMEMFPKGWLELAGPGQYAFHWVASDAGMRHRGTWRDPNGVPCPFEEKDFRCFTDYFKDQQLGHDEAHFANWTSTVLHQVKEDMLREASLGTGQPRPPVPAACACA